MKVSTAALISCLIVFASAVPDPPNGGYCPATGGHSPGDPCNFPNNEARACQVGNFNQEVLYCVNGKWASGANCAPGFHCTCSNHAIKCVGNP